MTGMRGSASYYSLSSPQHLWCKGAMRDAFEWNGLSPFFYGMGYPPLPSRPFWMRHCGFVPKAGLRLWSYERIYEANANPDQRPHICLGKGDKKCGRYVTCFTAECKRKAGPIPMCAMCLRSHARNGNLLRPKADLVMSVPYYDDRTRAAG